MKKYVCLMLSALLLLAGCSPAAAPVTTSTKTTVPAQTPTEMLSQCVQKVLDASSFHLDYALGDEKGDFTLQFSLDVAKDTRGGYIALLTKPCGCGEYISGKTCALRDCADGSVTHSTAAEDYGFIHLLRELPPLEKEVLSRFCNSRLTATPNTVGGMRFSCNELDKAQMEALLGTPIDAGEDFVGYFVLDMDMGGNIREVEYLQGSVTHRIVLTKINQKLEISKPDWA